MFNDAEFRRFLTEIRVWMWSHNMKMMEHLKIHVQCKRHRLLFLFPTESQSHWLHWLGFLPVCAFSHSSHLFYVDYFQRSLEGVSPNICKTTQLAHFGLLTTLVAFVCDISTVFHQMLSQIIHPRRWPITLSAFTAPWGGHWSSIIASLKLLMRMIATRSYIITPVATLSSEFTHAEDHHVRV